MSLASAIGIGEPSLVNVYYNGPKVKPENVYIIGARELDKGEIQLAKDLNLNLYTIDSINNIGLEKVIEQVLNRIYSSNIDVLDKSLVPGTGTPVANGLSTEEAKKILEKFLNTGLIKSMDFVELNPVLDKNNMTADLCIDLIDWIFKVIKE